MLSRALSPKVILLDIETSPNISATWGKWQQDVIWFLHEWEVLSFAYKELGKKPTRCISRLDFKDKTDRSITRAIWGVLDSADVVVAHNGDQFDVKKLRAKFVEHGLAPPRPFKTVDTLKIAKAQFAFTSNRLDDLAKRLRLGQKVQTGGSKLWERCMLGFALPGKVDHAAWRLMIRYNKWDVDLLERLYERLKAWHPSHPNLALYEERPGCPVCSSLAVQRRGYRVANVTRQLRYQCQEPKCGAWFSRSKPLEAA